MNGRERAHAQAHTMPSVASEIQYNCCFTFICVSLFFFRSVFVAVGFHSILLLIASMRTHVCVCVCEEFDRALVVLSLYISTILCTFVIVPIDLDTHFSSCNPCYTVAMCKRAHMCVCVCVRFTVRTRHSPAFDRLI